MSWNNGWVKFNLKKNSVCATINSVMRPLDIDKMFTGELEFSNIDIQLKLQAAKYFNVLVKYRTEF